ncbi:MAG: flagellar FliJ family protein [Thermosulfidibacteraceae bacterium]|jgi:flagellar FliJ protein
MSVISLLKRLENLKSRERERMLLELSEIDSGINRLRSERERLKEKLRNISIVKGDFVTVGQLNKNFQEIEFVVRRDREVEKSIKDLEAKREVLVQKLLELEKERKILMKLREKREEEMRKELLKREIKMLDEIGILRWKSER